jgi:hypothetical protein
MKTIPNPHLRGSQKAGECVGVGFSCSVVEPKLFVSSPTPGYHKLRSRLRLQIVTKHSKPKKTLDKAAAGKLSPFGVEISSLNPFPIPFV